MTLSRTARTRLSDPKVFRWGLSNLALVIAVLFAYCTVAEVVNWAFSAAEGYEVPTIRKAITDGFTFPLVIGIWFLPGTALYLIVLLLGNGNEPPTRLLAVIASPLMSLAAYPFLLESRSPWAWLYALAFCGLAGMVVRLPKTEDRGA